MKIGIDIGALLQERFNDALNKKLVDSCNDKDLDPKAAKLSKGLIELCNKHNMYGVEAISFVAELLNVLDEACREEEK